MAAETIEDRRARLQAELNAIDNDNREELISARASETSLGDVITHLVQHSGGYPSRDEREVHLRAVASTFAEPEQPAKAPAKPAS